MQRLRILHSWAVFFHGALPGVTTEEITEQDRDDDCFGIDLICLSGPRRCSCCTLPGTRVPTAASRPARNREFRHVPYRSRMLVAGSPLGMASSFFLVVRLCLDYHARLRLSIPYCSPFHCFVPP